MAHCLLSHDEMNSGFENVLLTLFSFLSCVGVPCFLIASGILFSKKPVREFMNKKAVSIVLPWIFCGFFVYLVTQFPAYSLLGCTRFLLGVGSFLYYIPVLIFCYFLFYILPDKRTVYIICIVLTCVSLLFTQLGLLCLPNNYLNVMNWIGYFAIGRWIQREDLLKTIRNQSRQTIIVCTGGVIAFCVAACVYTVETYFNVLILFAIPFFFLSIYVLSTLTVETNRYWRSIGKATYTIYLIHMPIAALLKRIVRMTIPQGYVFLPLFVVALTFFALVVLERIIGKNQKLDRIVGILLGLR